MWIEGHSNGWSLVASKDGSHAEIVSPVMGVAFLIFGATDSSSHQSSYLHRDSSLVPDAHSSSVLRSIILNSMEFKIGSFHFLKLVAAIGFLLLWHVLKR